MGISQSTRQISHHHFEILSMEFEMLVDTLPVRLAFWLDRPVRLDAIPFMPDRGPAARPLAARLSLRPAVDIETHLVLRDRGWKPSS